MAPPAIGLRARRACVFALAVAAGSCVPSGSDLPHASCTTADDCEDADSVCFHQVCVGEGQLRVSLTWTVVSDFDLHVQTPAGLEIWYGNPSNDGGFLDLDDCVGGQCANNPSGEHIENVYFPDNPAPGSYIIWVMNYDGRAGGEYTVETSTGAVFYGSLPAVGGAVSEPVAFEF